MEAEGVIWINGELIPTGQAKISASDRGFLLGEGVFESLRAYRGEPFALTRHVTRLWMGCEKLCIPPPSRGVIETALRRTMEANVIQEARLRITVTRGSGTQDTMPSMVVSAVPAPVWPPVECVVTVPWTRNENSPIAGIKSLSYGENALAMMHAREHGAGEAIFANTRGHLCEGSASNVFLVLNDRLLTPPLSSGCLPGVTRSLVLDICRQAGIHAFEEDVPLAALAEASEAFLTSSTREVHPISRVDARYHAPIPGPLTRKLVELFDELKTTCKDP